MLSTADKQQTEVFETEKTDSVSSERFGKGTCQEKIPIFHSVNVAGISKKRQTSKYLVFNVSITYTRHPKSPLHALCKANEKKLRIKRESTY